MSVTKKKQNAVKKRKKEPPISPKKLHILNQMHFDAFCIAVNEEFNVGKTRIEHAASTYNMAVNEIAEAMNNDSEDLELAKKRIDERLRMIFPKEQFKTFDERYYQ